MREQVEVAAPVHTAPDEFETRDLPLHLPVAVLERQACLYRIIIVPQPARKPREVVDPAVRDVFDPLVEALAFPLTQHGDEILGHPVCRSDGRILLQEAFDVGRLLVGAISRAVEEEEGDLAGGGAAGARQRRARPSHRTEGAFRGRLAILPYVLCAPADAPHGRFTRRERPRTREDGVFL